MFSYQFDTIYKNIWGIKMVIHLFDKFNENETLCNTKSKSKKNGTEDKSKVTCKKCNYILESERLLSLHSKMKGEIIANDIRGYKER